MFEYYLTGAEMCLAIPHQLIEITEEGSGLIEIGGLRQEIGLALVPEAEAGDWVLAYCGMATCRIDPKEASKILSLYHEISAMNTD